MTHDQAFMKMAIREARKGLGRTSPNPCVGAVVVKHGSVVGKGYHRKAGTPHAEVNALRAAGSRARGATLYVTLEPCNHTGRTPPCTRAILESGIARVVVGMDDPNPGVVGGGNTFLASRGLGVTAGVLETECRELNRPFIKHVSTGWPWVIMKAGASLDGRLASSTGKSGWITGEQSRRYVHHLRDRCDAIAIGIDTALTDDPSLTARLPRGRGRDPVRVILDTHLRLPATATMLIQETNASTCVFCGPDPDPAKEKRLRDAGAEVLAVPLGDDGRLSLVAVLSELGRRDILSVLVEGGGGVHGSFLRAGLVDEVNLFVAPLFIGSDGVPLVDALGLKSIGEAPRLKMVRSRRFGDDVMISGLL